MPVVLFALGITMVNTNQDSPSNWNLKLGVVVGLQLTCQSVVLMEI